MKCFSIITISEKMSVISMGLVAVLLIFFFIDITAQTIVLQNPGLDGNAGNTMPPNGWFSCNTSDQQPGVWGVTTFPQQGSAYSGMGHDPPIAPGWKEGIWQQVPTPLQAGTTYSISFYATQLSPFTVWTPNGPGEIEIWGGTFNSCGQGELLCSTGQLSTFWQQYTLTFTPSQTHSFIFFMANKLGINCAYLGLDNLSAITVVSGNITAGPNSTICAGQSVTLNASGASNYAWSPSSGLSNPNIANPVATPTVTTTYTVTGTSSSGCGSGNITVTATVTITVINTIAATVGPNSTICSGNAATLTATGGGNYSWSTGATTSSIIIIPASTTTYSVTVSNGSCTNVVTATVTVSPPVSASASATNTTCGSNNGTASVTAAGGIPPYTYLWSNGMTTSQISNLTNQTYSVIVTDAIGCSATAAVAVSTTSGFSINSSQSNLTCFGANNGLANITPTGGNAPYTYSWSTNPVQTSPSVSGLSAGTYTCMVTDAMGCTITGTFTITQPPAITGSITNSTNVSCFGGNNGSATVSATGGNPPYTYSWNTTPPQTGSIANNIMAGTSPVIITDVNGCTAIQTVTITQPPGMNLTSNSTPASCGMTDGGAWVVTAGGAAPYAYMWLTQPVQTTSTANNLSGGITYTLIVTDANGCTQQQTVLVGGGIPPLADFILISDTVYLPDTYVAFTDISSGAVSAWYWNFGDPLSGINNTSTQQNPSHTYSDTGTFCITLIITDGSGVCADTVRRCLKVLSPFTFYIPNAFTPNDDGLNELFAGSGTYIKEFGMSVFDRWGNLIFYSNDINKGWDGKIKNKGDIVLEDIYVWKANLTEINGKEHFYIGHVTLVK